MTKKERNDLIYKLQEEGYSQTEIGKFYDLSQSAISLIIIEKRKGLPERTEETRGQKSKLSSSELAELKKILGEKPALELGFNYWNKWSIQALIKEKFGVHYHENYIWKIMKKIGFTSQIPQKKDYRQDPKAVKEFKEKTSIAIKKSKG